MPKLFIYLFINGKSIFKNVFGNVFFLKRNGSIEFTINHSFSSKKKQWFDKHSTRLFSYIIFTRKGIFKVHYNIDNALHLFPSLPEKSYIRSSSPLEDKGIAARIGNTISFYRDIEKGLWVFNMSIINHKHKTIFNKSISLVTVPKPIFTLFIGPTRALFEKGTNVFEFTIKQ